MACVAMGVTANAIGVGGIPGILSIQPPYMASFAVCMAIAAAAPFLLTVAAGKRTMGKPQAEQKEESAEVSGEENAPAKAESSRPDPEETEEKKGIFTAFLSGKAISLEEVGDGVFSSGMMGEGMAILPDSDILCSPVDVEIAVLMQDSRHACGLRLSNGMELVLHIGIDTVSMNGDGFEYLVKEGKKVSAGTPLIKFDRAKIKAAGHPDVTICVIPNKGSAAEIQFHTGMDVKANETVVAEFR